jgi:methyltransferase (TIGR00027 family)
MPPRPRIKPDSTAVRVALWRALHVELDPPPHILTDELGLKLAAPVNKWRRRPDMHPEGTRRFRMSVVIRARFVEDLVARKANEGVQQYVLLGAGLDTFAQREPELASRLQIFEVDQPDAQSWKRKRLIDLGYELPNWLHLVPVDFEAKDDWWEKLLDAGFKVDRPAVVAVTGVSMYLTKAAVAKTLRQVARLASGSTLAMTFLLPKETVAPSERAKRDGAEKSARKSRTPFISFFTPSQMLALAREAGFSQVEHISGKSLTRRYVTDRTDDNGLPSAEEMLVAQSY